MVVQVVDGEREGARRHRRAERVGPNEGVGDVDAGRDIVFAWRDLGEVTVDRAGLGSAAAVAKARAMMMDRSLVATKATAPWSPTRCRTKQRADSVRKGSDGRLQGLLQRHPGVLIRAVLRDEIPGNQNSPTETFLANYSHSSGTVHPQRSRSRLPTVPAR